MQNLNKAIVISAPSGTGKTTLIKGLVSEDDRFAFVVSTTTRPKRASEIDGNSYYFVSVDEFSKMIDDDEFVEWAIVHENYYGTTKKDLDRINSLGKIPLFDVDVQGARQLKEKLREHISIFILPPSIEAIRERLMDRGTDSEEEINKRLKNIRNELREIHNYEYIIVNDVVSNALGDLRAIIRAESCKDKSLALQIRDILEVRSDITP
ncbi:MAG: guanylate kinase [Spirochaetota bacterium]|nr:guanylate kinase [Spirochaetota bacterium]